MSKENSNLRFSGAKVAKISGLAILALGISAQAATTVTSQIITGDTLYTPPAANLTDFDSVTACMGPAVSDISLQTEGALTPTIYRNAESEPSMAVNPVNPDNIVIAHHQDRISKSGGAVGIGIAVTQDGGLTWTRVKVPTTRCGGGLSGSAGDYERDTDPRLTFSADGKVLYLGSLPFNISQDFKQSYAVTRSLSNLSHGKLVAGYNWEPTVGISTDPGVRNLYDWDQIAVNPNTGKVYYSSVNYPVKGSSGKDFPFDNSGSNNNADKKMSVLLSVSTDKGQSFTQPKIIFDTSMSKSIAPLSIEALPSTPAHPNGVLVIPTFFSDANVWNFWIPKSGKGNLQIYKSYNQGQTFQTPIQGPEKIYNKNLVNGGPVDPDLGIFLNGGFGDFAVDPNNPNRMYYAWLDARFDLPTGVSVVISMSNDGGNTWSSPIKVSPNLPTGSQASGPNGLAVAADGTVGVTYMDFRNDIPGDDRWDADLYISLLKPVLSPTPHLVFQEELRITDQSMDVRQFITRKTIGSGGAGYFPGDYMSLRAIGNDFVAVNAITVSQGLPVLFPVNTTAQIIEANNRQDLLFTRVHRN